MFCMSSLSPFHTLSLPHHSYGLYAERLAAVPRLLADHTLSSRQVLVVTDEHVAAHYLRPLTHHLEKSGRRVKAIVVPPGEQTKASDPLQDVYDAALTSGVDRSTPVLALGGGVVGDLAGFAAATLLRGLPLVHLPTSLIAQVDSSIGGKTGINHAVGKNLIGAFYQPVFVNADPTTLNSLPLREWQSGLAEVVKHALIAAPAFFEELQTYHADVLSREPHRVTSVVQRAATIKAGIVASDVHEQGQRALLNFGHTFGHALESVCGYGVLTHGEAVFLGMRVALRVSHHLTPHPSLLRALETVQAFPVGAAAQTVTRADLMAAMQHDKKVKDGQVRFVLLREIGKAYITADVPPHVIYEAWADTLAESPLTLTTAAGPNE